MPLPPIVASLALLCTHLFALLLAPSNALAQATTNPQAQPTAAPTLKAPNTAPRGWWNDAVFYQVFVRSFNDSRTGPLANDGIGDLQGLTDKLDYIQSLGANALWLMPVTQSPSYHGYDTTDYRTVEQDYGTNEDFKRLVEQCRRRNIRIIIDLVLNHCSDAHPWFTSALNAQGNKRDWFIWQATNPGWRGPWNQTVWHRASGPTLSGFYYGIFNKDMPDLNYANPAVTTQMHDTARFWLTAMGIDGFRLDAVRHLIEDGTVQENTPATHDWLESFNAACKQARPDCFNVGEIWSTTDQIAPYVGKGMDSAFEFELATALLTGINTRNARQVERAIAQAWSAYDRGAQATFLTNHDQTRVATTLKSDPAKLRAAAALLLTMPGIPFIYYGEELGMTGDKPDPRLRTPMRWDGSPHAGFSTAKPWQPLSDDPPALNVAAQRADNASLLNWYTRLINARNTSTPLRRGDLTILGSQHQGLVAFTRAHQDQTVLVLVNLGNNTIDLPDDGWHPTLRARFARATNLLSTAQQPAPAPNSTPSPTPSRTISPGEASLWALPAR